MIVGIIIEKKVENTVAKGKIVRFKQFHLLEQCFQESSAAEASERVYMGERVQRKKFLTFIQENHI